ncbi:hypothetical protein F2Q69_00002769 [Brassica cretica]|uniref:Replication protein A 70 kDa DNA-binding subunit B/D first OB fold domain-containing protein n=1 Tax=Brassica cretica TaxID=69181 RepID=A0A8S9P855_BRACR|nr:hypothetical protein F2Q69_00002769 [Brassica cretica]
MVKVNIIRPWTQYSAAGSEAIEMVFVDSRGNNIHGTVKKDEVRPCAASGTNKIPHQFYGDPFRWFLSLCFV